jgi:hypothetical protein
MTHEEEIELGKELAQYAADPWRFVMDIFPWGSDPQLKPGGSCGGSNWPHRSTGSIGSWSVLRRRRRSCCCARAMSGHERMAARLA